jgi:hypothetical protein
MRNILLIVAGFCFVMLDGIQHVTNYVNGTGTLEQIGEGWLWIAGSFLAHAVWTKTPDRKERGELLLVGGVLAFFFYKHIDEGWLWVAGISVVYGLSTSGLFRRVDPPAFEGGSGRTDSDPERSNPPLGATYYPVHRQLSLESRSTERHRPDPGPR